MITKQKKLLIVCAAIFAALLLLYLIVVRPLVSTVEDPEDTDPADTVEGESLSNDGRYYMFPYVERAGMQSVKITNEYGTYEFYRDANGEFQIRGFEGTPYDSVKFASLVVGTGHTLSKVKVADNATDAQLAEYGLDNPQAQWTLTTTTGESYTVYVGYDLLTGGGYYCMLEGRRSVYVLDSILEESVLQPVEYLCSPLLLAGIDQSDYYTIDNFSILQDDELLCMISVTPRENQQNPESLQENYMRYPEGYFPNTNLYYDVLYSFLSLSGTSVEKLGPTEEEIAEYGLVDPAYTIYFEYNGVEVMLFFSEKQQDGTYYAQSTLFPHTVVKMDAATVYYLEYDLLPWLEPYPFQHWITHVESIEVVGSGADVKFTLSHGVDAAEKATLDVTASTGKVIPNAEVYNFRQFYKTLLSVMIMDYVPLTEEEIAALTTEENCILTFTITQLDGTQTVYRFYPYSSTGRRALMTVNGFGEFYVQTDLIEKIASDANKVLNDLDVDSYGKN